MSLAITNYLLIALSVSGREALGYFIFQTLSNASSLVATWGVLLMIFRPLSAPPHPGIAINGVTYHNICSFSSRHRIFRPSVRLTSCKD
jgi:hypothetical protein